MTRRSSDASSGRRRRSAERRTGRVMGGAALDVEASGMKPPASICIDARSATSSELSQTPADGHVRQVGDVQVDRVDQRTRTSPPATRRPLRAIGSTAVPPRAAAPPLGVVEAEARALLETIVAEPVDAACEPDAAAVALGALEVGPPDALARFVPASVRRTARGATDEA